MEEGPPQNSPEDTNTPQSPMFHFRGDGLPLEQLTASNVTSSKTERVLPRERDSLKEITAKKQMRNRKTASEFFKTGTTTDALLKKVAKDKNAEVDAEGEPSSNESEFENDEVTMQSEDGRVWSNVSAEEAEGFQTILHREIQKRTLKAAAKTVAFQKKIADRSRGVYRVRIGLRSDKDEHVPFVKGTLCRFMSEIVRLFPESNPNSNMDFIDVWVNDLQNVRELLKLKSLLQSEVVTSCNDLYSFRRIVVVDREFTEEEIKDCSLQYGEVSVRRENIMTVIEYNGNQIE